MNSEYVDSNESISLRGMNGKKWVFNIKSNDLFYDYGEYSEKDNEKTCYYNKLIENIHYDDILKVEEFFNELKERSIGNAIFKEIIFRFINSSGKIVNIFAIGKTNKEDSDIVDGYFFDIDNLIAKNNTEEILYENKETLINSVKCIFIIINNEEERVTLYGNNKYILGLDDTFIVMSFDECKKYIHEDYIKEINEFMKNNTNESLEIKINDTNKKEKWINLKGQYKRGLKDRLIGFEGIINDITSEKNASIRLKYMSDYDELTDIHNKKYFRKAIKKQIKKHLETNSRGALITIDLDNFKFINDSYGYKCGDLFIKEIAKLLENVASDKELICRFSGDEFLMFIPNIKSFLDVEQIANKIIHIFKETFYIEGNNMYSTASIGAAIYPDDGVDFDELLKNSNAAMNIAKDNGKNQYQFFNCNISYELNKIYKIQKGLRTALDKNEMFVVFQPKIMLNNNKTDGFEALLRWKSKELGFVSPAEFIPIAEINRMIIPIGNFVLEEVFSRVKYLLEQGYDNFQIAINLSEVQLRDRTLISIFKELIKKYDILPKYIEIEITESMLMKSFEKNINTLLEFKALGVSIALDDFGTGYSSLNYLTRLPIDVLKIDRSFVVDMIDNLKSRYIVENIIELSHKLGIKVVAEGVEELEQVDYLKSIYCDIVQGYYYSKPEVFEDVVDMLTK